MVEEALCVRGDGASAEVSAAARVAALSAIRGDGVSAAARAAVRAAVRGDGARLRWNRWEEEGHICAAYFEAPRFSSMEED